MKVVEQETAKVDSIGAKIDLLIQKLNQLLQQNEAHATIAVTTAQQRGIGNLLQTGLLETGIQPEAVGHW